MRRNKKFLILIIGFMIFFKTPLFNKVAMGIDNINYEEKEEEEVEKVKEVYDESLDELDELYRYINITKSDVDLMKELNPEEYVKSYITNGKGNISFEDVKSSIISILLKEVTIVLKLAISIIVVSVLSSLLKNLQDAFKSEGIAEVAFYACYSILIVLISGSFFVAVDVIKDVIYSVSDFMAAILPVLVSMVGLSGGLVQATMMDPIVMGAVIIIPRIYTTIIIPLISVSFALQFANNISKEHKINNLCSMVKKTAVWIQGIIITVFIALLTIRGITSNTLDAVAMKTTKFAIDNFIPIVGKSFSDAISSVAGYSLVIKNAISGIGLLVIILLIAYPIIKIVCMIGIYRFSSALIEPICDKRITDSIASVGDNLVILLSCLLSISLMFFILIGIMASAGKFIVGA